jgi:hypothetical protein
VPLDGVEISREIIHAIVDAFGEFRGEAWKVIERLGLDRIRDNDAEGWVTQEKWFELFNAVIENVGATMMFSIGQLVPSYARGWPQAETIDELLGSLDIAYHSNHRRYGEVLYDAATGELKGGIGNYRFERVPGENRATVICDNPYPCELDLGILTTLSRRFEAKARVDHAPLGCRTIGAHACTYVIAWE